MPIFILLKGFSGEVTFQSVLLQLSLKLGNGIYVSKVDSLMLRVIESSCFSGDGFLRIGEHSWVFFIGNKEFLKTSESHLWSFVLTNRITFEFFRK